VAQSIDAEIATMLGSTVDELFGSPVAHDEHKSGVSTPPPVVPVVNAAATKSSRKREKMKAAAARKTSSQSATAVVTNPTPVAVVPRS